MTDVEALVRRHDHPVGAVDVHATCALIATEGRYPRPGDPLAEDGSPANAASAEVCNAGADALVGQRRTAPRHGAGVRRA